MDAMRRWTVHILALLSLALMIGCAVLWVRGARVNDQLAYRNGRRGFMLMAVPNGLCLTRFNAPGDGPMVIRALSMTLPAEGWSFRTLPWGPNLLTSKVQSAGHGTLSLSFTVSMNNQWVQPANIFLGFGWETQPRPLVIVAPFWFLVIAFSIVPIVWTQRLWRDRVRRREGLCPRCGYDLRATPGRCPECGHVTGDDFHPAVQPVESADQ